MVPPAYAGGTDLIAQILRRDGTTILLIAAVPDFHVADPRAGGNQNQRCQDQQSGN